MGTLVDALLRDLRGKMSMGFRERTTRSSCRAVRVSDVKNLKWIPKQVTWMYVQYRHAFLYVYNTALPIPSSD